MIYFNKDHNMSRVRKCQSPTKASQLFDLTSLQKRFGKIPQKSEMFPRTNPSQT